MPYWKSASSAVMTVVLACACSAATEERACPPIGSAPGRIITSGAVTTRAGQTIDFTVDAGPMRVIGGQLPAEKSVYKG